jgi:hypothetical protein
MPDLHRQSGLAAVVEARYKLMDDQTSTLSGSEAALQTETSSGKRNLALSSLYWLELQAVKFQTRAVEKTNPSKIDCWWASVDGSTQGPYCFAEIQHSLLQGFGTLSVLPEARSGEDSAPWQTVSYRPLWLQRPTALVWTASFWLLAAVLGWAFVCLLAPISIEGPVQLAYWIIVAIAALVNAIPQEKMLAISNRLAALTSGSKRGSAAAPTVAATSPTAP